MQSHTSQSSVAATVEGSREVLFSTQIWIPVDCVITHGLLSTYLPSHLDDGNDDDDDDDDDDDGGGGDDEGKNGANKCRKKRGHETQDIKVLKRMICLVITHRPIDGNNKTSEGRFRRYIVKLSSR
ncbi:hypothetical protein KQX54_006793 [Cotesia glomerata]|uniref:Uncharacterized protein n=1 Tax=Cotesia glomerata TaxID=32391 RepID=A0AAV7HYW9_COTGL|nr:hypothetical protein KQX54_006793 [Cotesia glomerata]